MSTVVKDLGAVSAYAYAVEKGYTGTEAEFAELMAGYAEVGQRAENAAESALNSKAAAQTAATTATNKASEATTAATTATTKAGEASQSASQASTSAQTASTKASEASQSASTASAKATEATTAATSANTAKTDAVAAKTAAETAQGKAETAQGAAEDAAQSVSASAAQIATNTADITDLKEGLSALSNSPFVQFFDHVSNPLIKTSIKMVGDSITAGLGGTGYSATDETIIGSSQKTNVKTAICWANMFYHYLMDNFAGDKTIEASDARINISGLYQINMNVPVGNQQITYHSEYSTNTVANKCIEFEMYGTGFSIIYSKAAVYGIFDVYVDGTLNTSVDCYASSTSHGVTITIDGLTEGTHTIAIYSTNTKNASSSGKQFYIHGFIVSKEIEWHNYGISGTSVNSGINSDGRYTTDDDFVFIMYGTNNRVTSATWNGFITEYKQLYNFLTESYGIIPIIITPPPASEAQDTTNSSTTYMFHTYNIQMAIKTMAKAYNVPFIDVYNDFLEYADIHDISYTTLLVDGLHPNDSGYNVIYHSVIKGLGLPLMAPYKEWYQPT